MTELFEPKLNFQVWSQSILNNVNASFSSQWVQTPNVDPKVRLYASESALWIVSITLLVALLRPLLPSRPIWLTNFVREGGEGSPSNTQSHQHSYRGRAILLSLISLAGVGVQAVSLWDNGHDLPSLLSCITWAFSLATIALMRSCVTSTAIVVTFASLLGSHTVIILADPTPTHPGLIYKGAQLLLSCLGIATILTTSLRDPKLPTKGIAKPFTPPDPELCSPEDNITLWQWMTVSWLSPLLSLGKNRQLNEDDVWFLGQEFHHQKLHAAFRELTGSVIRRLLVANGLDLMITSFLGLVELASDCLQPILLKLLLGALENPDGGRHMSLVFALLTLVNRIGMVQSNVFLLWFGRRCYERSRGEMITMLYQKTLARRMVPSGEKDTLQTEDATCDSSESAALQPEVKTKTNLLSQLRQFFGRRYQKEAAKKAEDSASSGKILNLMRNDVYEVAQRFWEFRDLITVPIQVVVVVILIWQMLGWACLLGTIALLIGQIATAMLAKKLAKWEKRRRSATDQRLNLTSQFIEAIRHLRWYGWQDQWQERINEKRGSELRLIWTTRIWQIVILFVNVLAHVMFPVTAFFAFTVLTGQPLRVEIAFPALNLFQLLDNGIRRLPQLVTALINGKVALDRIQHFMEEPDKPQMSRHELEDNLIETHHASFAWSGSSHPVLSDVSIAFSTGVTVISGKVGAGKTALLLGLLGELDLLDGCLNTSFEPVGYFEQRPWLQSMSIRDNILFHAPFNEERYKAVLDACMLVPDLANFRHGDLSNIGENGVGLSGGQRARVALARAIYSPAPVLMLDDPLSSLDHNTAESIVQKCFAGPLLKGRTLILVTHRLDLCRHMASSYLEVVDGTVHTRSVTELPDPVENCDIKVTQVSDETVDKQVEDDSAPAKFIEDEYRAHGGIPLAVYWAYIKAGKLSVWSVLVIVLTLFRFIDIGRQWFLKEWGEAYNQRGLFYNWPSPADNIKPWVLGFFLISLLLAIFRVLAQGALTTVALFASRKLFQRALDGVTHSTFRFYDVTPVGRLMNRMTSDMGMIDGELSMQFALLSFCLVMWATALGVLSSIAPLFLGIAVFLVSGFVMIFMHFLPTSQSLRRLETASLSPLISDFGALVDGLTTIRAFCAQHTFQNHVIRSTDEFQRMDHFYWSLQAWLTYRVESMSAAVIFLLTVVGIYSDISAGVVAFALINAAQFVQATHEMCKIYGQLQMDFVSVERIVEMIQLEQEPRGEVDPPAMWPTYAGDIVFDHVTVRYAEHMDPALVDLSFTIKGGSITAIVGRTGSGKSTLAAALLAIVQPEEGSITIDGIDTASVNKQALRSRITFVAQDPVLFPGTLRQNLDPMLEHSDEDCERVLSKVSQNYGWSLESKVDSSGRNFSQGQRQIIGLARAILRRSAVVILDEATASIDVATSNLIQNILRQEMQASTVLTIAHRAEAVQDASSCIVLQNGKLVEHRNISAST